MAYKRKEIEELQHRCTLLEAKHCQEAVLRKEDEAEGANKAIDEREEANKAIDDLSEELKCVICQSLVCCNPHSHRVVALITDICCI